LARDISNVSAVKYLFLVLMTSISDVPWT